MEEPPEETAQTPGNNGSNSEFYPTPEGYPSANRIRSVGGGQGAAGETNAGNSPALVAEQVVLVVVLLDMDIILQEELAIQQIQIIQNVKDLMVDKMVLVMEITTSVVAAVVLELLVIMVIDLVEVLVTAQHQVMVVLEYR